MKKYKLEIILFMTNAIYMMLELIASRVLSPYFGSSNIVWTAIIGVILFSSSIGNFIGGKIADKKENKLNIKNILIIVGIFILLIPFVQEYVLVNISKKILNLEIGAIISAIILFFIPSMFFGFFSPIIIAMKTSSKNEVGSTSGKMNGIATIGSLFGTFMGGFLLIPMFGSNELLFILSATTFLLVFLGENIHLKDIVATVVLLIISCISFYVIDYQNEQKIEDILQNRDETVYTYDSQYNNLIIKNGVSIRYLMVGNAIESASFIETSQKYELVSKYLKFYDLMFESSNEIKETLMIGGGGYSYPKYYISKYEDKKMDVVEIDDGMTKLAKQFFYLDDLIKEYDLDSNKRLNLINKDGRIYLNQNRKKYDAILNDAFHGFYPPVTLTTIKAIKKIHDSINENGIYLTNIVGSIEGEKALFLKAEVNTIKKVFKNVYVIPCNYVNNKVVVQNIMVIATDDNLILENNIELEIPKNTIILTDNYAPIDSLVKL